MTDSSKDCPVMGKCIRTPEEMKAASAEAELLERNLLKAAPDLFLNLAALALEYRTKVKPKNQDRALLEKCDRAIEAARGE